MGNQHLRSEVQGHRPKNRQPPSLNCGESLPPADAGGKDVEKEVFKLNAAFGI